MLLVLPYFIILYTGSSIAFGHSHVHVWPHKVKFTLILYIKIRENEEKIKSYQGVDFS